MALETNIYGLGSTLIMLYRNFRNTLELRSLTVTCYILARSISSKSMLFVTGGNSTSYIIELCNRVKLTRALYNN